LGGGKEEGLRERGQVTDKVERTVKRGKEMRRDSMARTKYGFRPIRAIKARSVQITTNAYMLHQKSLASAVSGVKCWCPEKSHSGSENGARKKKKKKKKKNKKIKWGKCPGRTHSDIPASTQTPICCYPHRPPEGGARNGVRSR
jgi:hypothetical protein